MTDTMTPPTSRDAILTFLRVGMCSQTLCTVLDRSLGQPLPAEERASAPLAGGIMRGEQCGQVWGSALAAGAQAYRLYGAGPRAQAAAIAGAARIVSCFGDRYEGVDCREITGVEMNNMTLTDTLGYFRKNGLKCFRMAGDFAPVAFAEIDSALAEEEIEVPEPPLSCSALLAEMKGESDLRVVMAAGLAGGIGLSGRACGALGAAVWLAAIHDREQGRKAGYHNPRALELIDRFGRCTDERFACAEVVGRRFEGIADHATYLREGGCRELIEVLAY